MISTFSCCMHAWLFLLLISGSRLITLAAASRPLAEKIDEALVETGKTDCDRPGSSRTECEKYDFQVEVNNHGQLTNKEAWLEFLLNEPLNACWADVCGYFRCRRHKTRYNTDPWADPQHPSPQRIFVSKRSWMTKRDGDNAAFESKENTMFRFMFSAAIDLCYPKGKKHPLSIYLDWLDRHATNGNVMYGQKNWNPDHILRVQHKLGKAIEDAADSLSAKVFIAQKGSPPAGPFCRAELCCFVDQCCGTCANAGDAFGPTDDPESFLACLKSAPDHCCGSCDTCGHCSKPEECALAVASSASLDEIVTRGQCMLRLSKHAKARPQSQKLLVFSGVVGSSGSMASNWQHSVRQMDHPTQKNSCRPSETATNACIQPKM